MAVFQATKYFTQYLPEVGFLQAPQKIEKRHFCPRGLWDPLT